MNNPFEGPQFDSFVQGFGDLLEKHATATAEPPADTTRPLHWVNAQDHPVALCGAVVRDRQTPTAGRDRCFECMKLYAAGVRRAPGVV